MYKVVCCYTDEVLLYTADKKEAIKKLKDLELKDYHKYLDYCQKCYDNYEDPAIDERPADFYPTYFIEIEDTDKYYTIENYRLLERDNSL